MRKTEAQELSTEEVTCSFCSGTGKDPFGIMSKISVCCVCGGNGTIQMDVSFTRCAHCNGTGAIKRLTCTACRGAGFLSLVAEPSTICLECGGTGDDSSDAAMPCLRCRGRGRESL